jgi:hypothetical protein
MVPSIRFRHRHGTTVSVETRAGGVDICITTAGGYLQHELDAEDVSNLQDWLNQHFPPSPANSLP